MTTTEIIKKAREKKGLTQTEVASQLGIGLRQYQKIEDGKFPKFKRDQIAELDKILGTNTYVLIYEQDQSHQKVELELTKLRLESLLDERKENPELYLESRRKLKLENLPAKIPFYDTEAIAGITSEIDMSPTQAPTSQIDIGDFLRDSTAAIRVYGNSMIPNYPPGCVIGLVPNEDGIIQPGEVYVVETSTNRYIKRLYYNDDRSAYVCYSDNVMKYEEGPMAGRYCYDKFEIPLQKVKRVFEVTGVIKRNRNSPILQK